MDEPVREETVTEEKRTYFDRDRYSALSRAIWRDFGPLIMGALVLLIVLGGGWYLWTRSQQAPEETAVVIEENGRDISLPTSEITIPGAASPRPTPSPSGASPTPGVSPSPSPSPTPPAGGSPKPSPAPSPLAMANGAKGGQLPKTGPEALLALLFTCLTGAGFALHKLSKKI